VRGTVNRVGTPLKTKVIAQLDGHPALLEQGVNLTETASRTSPSSSRRLRTNQADRREGWRRGPAPGRAAARGDGSTEVQQCTVCDILPGAPGAHGVDADGRRAAEMPIRIWTWHFALEALGFTSRVKPIGDLEKLTNLEDYDMICLHQVTG